MSVCLKLTTPVYRLTLSPKGASPSGCTDSATLMRLRYSVEGLTMVSAWDRPTPARTGSIVTANTTLGFRFMPSLRWLDSQVTRTTGDVLASSRLFEAQRL